LDDGGRVSIVTFDVKREATTIFDTARDAGAQVDLDDQAALYLTTSHGRLVCTGLQSTGNWSVDCFASASDGSQLGYSIGVFEQGVVVVIDPSGPTTVYAAGPQQKLRTSGPSSTPGTAKNFYQARAGMFFQLQRTNVTCHVLGGQSQSIVCGVTDDRGLGRPNTFAGSVREDGKVTVVRYDARRRATVVYTSPSSQS
jgi:hypothetical protein